MSEVILCAAILLPSLCCSDADVKSNFSKLCQKQESSVQTCHAKYRWIKRDVRHEDVIVEFWMDGDLVRSDVTGRKNPDGSPCPKITYGKNWPTRSTLLMFNRDSMPYIIDKESQFPFWNAVSGYTNLPHKFGLTSGPIFSTYQRDWDELIRIRPKLVETKVIGNDDLISLSGLTDRANVDYETIHSRMFDYYPAKHRSSVKLDGIQYRTDLTNILKRDAVTGTIYVDRLEYSQSENGQDTVHEVIEMIECQFNTKIDRNVFTLSNLGISRGSQIRYDLKESKTPKYWDGAKEVNHPLPDVEKKIDDIINQRNKERWELERRELENQVPTPETPVSSSRIYYILGITFFAVGLCFFLWKLSTSRVRS